MITEKSYILLTYITRLKQNILKIIFKKLTGKLEMEKNYMVQKDYQKQILDKKKIVEINNIYNTGKPLNN